MNSINFENKNFKNKLGFLLVTTIICFVYLPTTKTMQYRDSLSPSEEQEFVKLFVFDKNLKQQNANIKKLEQDAIIKLQMLNLKPGYLFKTTNWKGHGLIHIAASFPFYDAFLKELIKKGEDPNLQTQDSKATPLHFASQASLNNIKILLETGKIANFASKDINGKNPLHYFADIANQKMDINDLIFAAQYLVDFSLYNFGQTLDPFFKQKDKNGKLPADYLENKKGFEYLNRTLKHAFQDVPVAITMEYIADPAIREYKSTMAYNSALKRKIIESTIILDIQKDPITGKTIKLSEKQENALRYSNGNYGEVDREIYSKWNVIPDYKFTTKMPEKIIVKRDKSTLKKAPNIIKNGFMEVYPV